MGFDSILVVGLGLIGGSIAGSVARSTERPVLYGIDIDNFQWHGT